MLTARRTMSLTFSDPIQTEEKSKSRVSSRRTKHTLQRRCPPARRPKQGLTQAAGSIRIIKDPRLHNVHNKYFRINAACRMEKELADFIIAIFGRQHKHI